MLPNFIGLGANRAGSTWLYHNLNRHHDVFMPRGKELHYFDRHYDEGLSYYEAQFAEWVNQPAVGEITPRYLYSETIARAIRHDLPDIRLFVSLRNPVDRAYSQYWRMVATSDVGQEESFESALESKPTILNDGRYYAHLSKYFDLFNPQCLWVIKFDAIKSEPETVLRDLFKFLGVSTQFDGEYTVEPVNSAASLQNLARSKWLWYAQRGLNRLHLNKLRFGLERVNRTELPEMNSETRRRLTNYYRDDVLRTQDLVQMDFSDWLRVESV